MPLSGVAGERFLEMLKIVWVMGQTWPMQHNMSAEL